jgi:hypothetical protein
MSGEGKVLTESELALVEELIAKHAQTADPRFFKPLASLIATIRAAWAERDKVTEALDAVVRTELRHREDWKALANKYEQCWSAFCNHMPIRNENWEEGAERARCGKRAGLVAAKKRFASPEQKGGGV